MSKKNLVDLTKPFGLCFALGLLLVSSTTYGQNDTLRLNEANVIDYRSNLLNTGLNKDKVDSITLKSYSGSSLSELLASFGSVYVKSNGPGNLATTSFRGGASSHTAIIWHGFNLNNSMNGLVDLSLIPVGLNDQIEIQAGATTSIWGSGALGGAILLNQTPSFKSGWKTSFSMQTIQFDGLNRLNGYSHNTKISFGNSRFYGNIKSYGQESDNNYLFSDTFSSSNSNGINSNLHAWNNSNGVLGDLYWKISNKQLLSVHYWYQEAFREIPRTISASILNYGYPFLRDKTHRSAVNYHCSDGRWKLNFRSAYVFKNLLYFDRFIENSRSISGDQTNEIEASYLSKYKWIASIGLNQNFSFGENSNYAEIVTENQDSLVQKQRNSFAFFSSFRRNFLNEKLALSINLRQQIVDKEFVPFTPSIGADYQLFSNTELKANIARVYRIPNLNDLYWNPGGNPDLLSEDGLAGELSGIYSHKLNKGLLKLVVTGFYRSVDNWIQWFPGTVWSPQNLLKVESYGSEIKPSLTLNFNKLRVKTSLSFNYTISQNIKSSSGLENTIDKQLIYTPIYQGNALLELGYKRFDLLYIHRYTGYTYTSRDHSNFISPYDVANTRLSYSQSLFKSELSFWIGVNNLFGEVYQVVLQRPMPLTNFQLGFQINFNHK